MKAKLEADGERMVPEHHKGRNVYGAHLARYKAALPFVEEKTVLDIACGSGYGTKLMSEKAKHIYGVDVSQDAVAYAEAHYGASNITYKAGDGKTIPLDDASVDVVVSYETIEHVEKYEDFLREIKRVLKPDGTLLISTPNEAEYPKGNHFHYREFTHKELIKLLGKYFKNTQQYFQTYWLYSTLLPLDLQAAEWDAQLRTINTCEARAEESLYFLMVCSDAKNNRTIESMGVIGERHEPIAVQMQKQEEYRTRKDLEQKVKTAEKELAAAQKELHVIKSSKAWKVARSMQRVSGRVRKQKP